MSLEIADKKSDLRFVFINFEEYWDESNSYPMGILYISACLKRSGFTNIGYIDHTCVLRKMREKTGRLFEFLPPETALERMSEERKQNLERLLENLRERQPHVILLGPVTTFYLVELVDLVRRLREQFPEQLILAGGPHFGKDDSLDSELLKSHPELDGAVVGEAEETMVEVAEKLYSEYRKSHIVPARAAFRSRLSEIAGVHVRNKKLLPRSPPRRLDDLPSPDMELLEKHLKDPWAYMNFPKYRLSHRRDPVTWISRGTVEADDGGSGSFEDEVHYFGKYMSRDHRFPFGVIVGSRGCPYKCSFCCSSSERCLHSAIRVFDHIVDLNKRYGIRQFVFFDPLFTTSSPEEKKRVEELCSMICSSGLDIRYIIDIRADIILNLPEELLARMMQSGCAEFNLGLEKGSDRMLQKMMKGITVRNHHDAIARLRRVAKSVEKEIIVNGTFILGGPGETKRDLRETIIHCLSLDLDEVTFYPLAIHPGTQIYREAVEEGILRTGLAPFLKLEEYPLHATKNLSRSFLINIETLSRKLLDEREELKRAMQEIERQFLPESERDRCSFDIKRTKKLHSLIAACIDAACDYLLHHPNEGLSKNGLRASPIELHVQNVNREIDLVEKQLTQEYPNYDPFYGNYHPGTLSAKWKRFLELFDELFQRTIFQ